MKGSGAKAEEALQESEEKYRLLFENANDAIFIAQDGVIKFPNPGLLGLVGYSAEKLAQMPFTALVHPADRAMVLERYQKRIAGAPDWDWHLLMASLAIMAALFVFTVNRAKAPLLTSIFRPQKKLSAKSLFDCKLPRVKKQISGISSISL